MPDEQPAEFTPKIVAAYVRGNQVPADQLASLISAIHLALARLGKTAAEAAERTPAVPIHRSVHRDHAVTIAYDAELADRWKRYERKRRFAHQFSFAQLAMQLRQPSGRRFYSN